VRIQESQPAPAAEPGQPSPPAQLAPPAQGPVSITTVGADAKPITLNVPTSAGGIRQLRAQRDEIAGQLSNVTARRENLAAEIRNRSDATTRTGLENRLGVLDQRIIQLETDLATIGRQIASAPTALVELADEQQGGGEGHFEEGVATGAFPVFFLASAIFLYRRWRRKRQRPPRVESGESSERLERLEHGVDAIAVEVERISEGQRFVTRLLSEAQPAFGQPARVGQAGAVQGKDPA
jgi:hypothetical protein